MTSLPDIDLPCKKKTSDYLELFGLRLGGVHQDVPGQFRDVDTKHFWVNPNCHTKKKFATHSNPHPGAPSIDNPLGKGPPEMNRLERRG